MSIVTIMCQIHIVQPRLSHLLKLFTFELLLFIVFCLNCWLLCCWFTENYRLQIGDVRACHLLPKTEKQTVPSVIVKFVHFHQNIDINNSRMVLSCPNMLLPTNKNPIFLKERLAKNGPKVKIYAEKDKNLVTTTFRSHVKVFVKNDKNKIVWRSCPEPKRRR